MPTEWPCPYTVNVTLSSDIPTLNVLDRRENILLALFAQKRVKTKVVLSEDSSQDQSDFFPAHVSKCSCHQAM